MLWRDGVVVVDIAIRAWQVQCHQQYLWPLRGGLCAGGHGAGKVMMRGGAFFITALYP